MTEQQKNTIDTLNRVVDTLQMEADIAFEIWLKRQSPRVRQMGEPEQVEIYARDTMEAIRART